MSPPSHSSSGSDGDDALGEDMETLRRARAMTGRNPSDVDEPDTDSGGESSGADDIDLLRRLQERFSLPSSQPWGAHSLPIVKPLSTRPPPDSDEEDDFETLRVIRKRFAQYEQDAIKKKSANRLEEAGMEVANGTSRREKPDVLSRYENCTTLSKESPDFGSADVHQAEDETCNISGKPFLHSHFPESAQNFTDALKKNRSCQKFIRRKLIEIQAKIEENKELRERIKCLVDFQVACKKNVGRIFCQQHDPRIRLISTQKSSTTKTPKTSLKKVPALCFGPVENSHVSRYKLVMTRFPVSLHKQKWSNIEKEKLAKGLKQQCQEMLMWTFMNRESHHEGPIGSNLMPAQSSSDLEVTPEKIRSSLDFVNWDRLASMYLTSRSGAECESRWLNCEDPMISHNPWTISEEKKLLYIVQERGLYNWIDIAKTLGTHRTPFQCLARYQRSLNPHILNRDWTEEEDAKLLAAVENFGTDSWQTIASNLEGRSGVQCSNRWRKSLHPDRKKVGRWSVDEDKCLKVAVILFGAKNWNKIAQFAPGRTHAQCRERWLNCLDPSLNLEPWTEEEDTKLLAAIADHGYSWSKVATCVPPRTDNQCRRRWKFLRPNEVPLLRAAKEMRKTVLISNFVDRESERPLIGPDDFSPLVLPPAAEDGKSKRPRRNRSRKSRVGSRSSPKENITADGMVNSSSDIAPADLSLVPGVKSTTAESGTRKRAPTKTRNNLPKKSRAKSRKSLEQNLTADGIVNSSSDIASTALSLVPGVNPTTSESGRMKRTRKKTSSDNLRKKSKTKSRSSLEENPTADGMVNTSSDIVPAVLSLVSGVNRTRAGSGIMKRTRKKITSSGSPQPLHSNNSKGRTRRHKEHIVEDNVVNNRVAENAPSDNPIEAGLESPFENRSRKRTRSKISRCCSNDSESILSNKPRAKIKTSPRKSLTTNCIVKDNDNVSREKKKRKLISKRGNEVGQLHMDHTSVNIVSGSAPISDGTLNTVAVSHSNTANGIGCSELSGTSGPDESLPDSTSRSEAVRRQECLDGEVALKGVENPPENNGTQNTMRELGSELGENIRSDECHENLPLRDRSASGVVGSEQSTESSLVRPARSRKSVSLVKRKQILRQRFGIVSNSSETPQSQGTSPPGLETSGNEPGPA